VAQGRDVGADGAGAGKVEARGVWDTDRVYATTEDSTVSTHNTAIQVMRQASAKGGKDKYRLGHTPVQEFPLPKYGTV
jgi:hypothetical protein